MQRKRVLIGSPIHQKPQILKEFLESLTQLSKETIEVGYYFIDDNGSSESSELLQDFNSNHDSVIIIQGNKLNDYYRDDNTHYWSANLVWKVADFKDRILNYAVEQKFDYVFLVDSDILLYPDTVEHLAGLELDVVSEVFWTRWYTDSEPLPNVWLFDNYDMIPRKRGENLTPEESKLRQEFFLHMLREPGVYEVGMLGACTLISKKAILAGASFKPVKNLTFWGEDRHFCVRASVLGLSLFVDTYYPACHIYRESELERVPQFKKTAGWKI